jgi:Na(+)/H(+) exchange regulatory cofactor NHE-RF1
MDEVLRNAPSAPRLCHVAKVEAKQEYGYNLHAERNKGQFIGNVDLNSPADIAGLKSGDRIIAVNGSLIANETHKQVSQLSIIYLILMIY